MNKTVWGIIAGALLVIGGVALYQYQNASAEKWEQELIRRNVEVGGPGGPLPLGLWPGTPRKVALDTAQTEARGRFTASSGQTATDVTVPGVRIAEEPCVVHLIFHADRLLAVAVFFDNKSPVSTSRLKLILEAKFGSPEKSASGARLSWKIEKPPPFTVTAGLIGTQLVVVYQDAGETGRAANATPSLEDLKKLVEKMDAAK